jgi:hypothetical protein
MRYRSLRRRATSFDRLVAALYARKVGAVHCLDRLTTRVQLT